MQRLQFPLSTGQVVELLQTPEHRVINPIRLGKIKVPNVGGRRLWYAAHVMSVAKILGKDTPEIRNICQAYLETNHRTNPERAQE